VRHVRSDHQVTSKAVVVATGVTEDGRREILGIEIGDSEDEAFWREFLRSLKRRGLSGVRLVISDQHAGLVAAIARCFQGAGHQRCRVHFARNLLANIPKGHQEMVSAAFRTIFAQVSPDEIAAQWDHVANMLTERFDKAAALMVRAKEEVLAFRTFPQAHWRQIWSTNPLERLNKEIKRRSRVVGIFPNEAAAIRLCGAVVLDINDEWASAERRYFSEGSMAGLYPPRDDDDATPGELVPAQ
jgi:putative transposase